MSATHADVVWLDGPRRLRLESEPLASPAAGELLCETLVTAISPGTELAAWTGLPSLHGKPIYPRLQGYCNVARVLRAGEGVTSVRAGDRILSFSSHRSHFVIAADDALAVLPDAARSEDAACAYLFHLGYNAVLRGGVRAGSRVLVIGLGALGLASVALAVRAGARVVAVSDQESPGAKAREVGALAVLDRAGAARLADVFDGALADVVITTSNRWDDWATALECAGPRACVAVLGFPGRGQPAPESNPLDSRHFYARQLRIEAVGMSPERPDARGFARFNERENLQWLVGEIAAGRLSPAILVSGVVAASELASAYDRLESRADSPVTYLLRWNQD